MESKIACMHLCMHGKKWAYVFEIITEMEDIYDSQCKSNSLVIRERKRERVNN